MLVDGVIDHFSKYIRDICTKKIFWSSDIFAIRTLQEYQKAKV